MLIDTHCHLASHRFAVDERAGLIDRAIANGVEHLITLATNLDDLAVNLALAEHPQVSACIGIHPCDVHHAPPDVLERLAAHVGNPRVAAIGETGLDYYHPAPAGWEEAPFRDRQRDLLRGHFQLAADAGLNVVIHTRDTSGTASFDDALEIFRDFHRHVRAVFHCYIGSWENAQRVLELGGLLSFGGVATFKNSQALRETVHRCPVGSFMVETDAPYLAPDPMRGQRNEPAWIRFTAERLAIVRGESFDEFIRHTGSTANAFFRF